MTSPATHYRERLGLPALALEDFVDRPKVKPFHLMVLALIAHGAPMTLGEIVARLSEAGAGEDRTSAHALQKATKNRASGARAAP